MNPPTPGPTPPPKPKPPESLRRELLAILFLYGVLAIIPLLIGVVFGPA